MRKSIFIFAISLIISAGARAQVQPVNSAVPSTSAATSATSGPNGAGTGNGDVSLSVFEGPTRFEGAIEYAFTHHEELPNHHPNLNGFVGSLTWFLQHNVGIEGQLLGGLANGGPTLAKLAFAGGGAHARARATDRLQPWAHVLVGYATILPQTQFGKQRGFGWEAGGGIDYRMLTWLSIRGGADALGTTFFNTNQVSPVIHGGFVLNF